MVPGMFVYLILRSPNYMFSAGPKLSSVPCGALTKRQAEALLMILELFRRGAEATFGNSEP